MAKINTSQFGGLDLATRTALKALDTTSVTYAYLTEAGRSGAFVFRSGDYASEVTADTQEGVYIKADDTATTSGAWVRDFDGQINVKMFGATGDGVTEDTTAVQAAIDFVQAQLPFSSNVAAYVDFPPGQYLLGQITVYSYVFLRGYGSTASELKAKNSLNDHLIITEDVNTLANTNVWLDSEGVQQQLGFTQLRIDGNKANQSAGDVMRLYAKGLHFDDVIISDAHTNGIYSEAGENASVSTWADAPEGYTSGLVIADCGGAGWYMRGPHDLSCNRLVVFQNGSHGIVVQSSSGNYLATTDFEFVHSYANGNKGIYVIDSLIRASMIRCENNVDEGIRFQNADHCQIANLSLFDNCGTSGSYQLVIDASSAFNTIDNIICRTMGRSGAIGGIELLGSSNKLRATIRGDVSGGGNSSGIGIRVAASNYNDIKATVSEFSTSGGVGIRTIAGSASNRIEATISNCATLWNNVGAGTLNKYIGRGQAESSQTQFFGVGPAKGANREDFDLHFSKASATSIMCFQTATDELDLNSTSEQTLTFAINMIAAPVKEDILVALSANAYEGTAIAVQYMYVREDLLSATNVTIMAKLSTAKGSAGTADVNIRVRL